MAIVGSARQAEHENFHRFSTALVDLDQHGRIYNCIWMNYGGFVRLLIDSQYVFGPFWDSERSGDDFWKRKFATNRRRAHRALADGDVPVLLGIVMDRPYTLRNQLVHGGATWQSRVNRDQVINGKRMLMEFLGCRPEHQQVAPNHLGLIMRLAELLPGSGA